MISRRSAAEYRELEMNASVSAVRRMATVWRIYVWKCASENAEAVVVWDESGWVVVGAVSLCNCGTQVRYIVIGLIDLDELLHFYKSTSVLFTYFIYYNKVMTSCKFRQLNCDLIGSRLCIAGDI